MGGGGKGVDVNDCIFLMVEGGKREREVRT